MYIYKIIRFIKKKKKNKIIVSPTYNFYILLHKKARKFQSSKHIIMHLTPL